MVPRGGLSTGHLQVSLTLCFFDDIHPHTFIVLGRYKGINHDFHLVQACWELCKILAVSQITLFKPYGGNFMEMTLRQS